MIIPPPAVQRVSTEARCENIINIVADETRTGAASPIYSKVFDIAECFQTPACLLLTSKAQIDC